MSCANGDDALALCVNQFWGTCMSTPLSSTSGLVFNRTNIDSQENVFSATIFHENEAVISITAEYKRPSNPLSSEEQEFQNLLNEFEMIQLQYMNLLVNKPDFRYVAVMQMKYSHAQLAQFVESHPNFRDRLPELKLPEQSSPKRHEESLLPCPDNWEECLRASDRDIARWVEPYAKLPYSEANKNKVLELLGTRDRPCESHALFVYVAQCANPTLRSHLLLNRCLGDRLDADALIKYVNRTRCDVIEALLEGIIRSDNNLIDASVLQAADSNTKANFLLLAKPFLEGLPQHAPPEKQEGIAHLTSTLYSSLN